MAKLNIEEDLPNNQWVFTVTITQEDIASLEAHPNGQDLVAMGKDFPTPSAFMFQLSLLMQGIEDVWNAQHSMDANHDGTD